MVEVVDVTIWGHLLPNGLFVGLIQRVSATLQKITSLTGKDEYRNFQKEKR